MNKKRNMWIGLVFLMVLFAGLTVQAEENQDGSENYKIGVAVYSQDSQEMMMFMNYYRDYIEAGFPVQFYFSNAIETAEQEQAFIEALKEVGAKGVISFCGYELADTVKLCEENEMYYILGSTAISDEVYEAVKGNPWFLGSIGPNPDSLYEVGCDMAEFFIEKDARSFVIMTGAASSGYVAHATRVKGMLETLEEKCGLVLEEEADVLAVTTENVTLSSEDGSVSVILCPGATEGGDGLANLQEAFAKGNCDALMSAFHASTYLDKIAEKEAEQGSNIMVGAIDSFTEANFEAIKAKDAFGNASIDYVQGKYGSMAGPAFAMMYNAITGHPEANSEDGNAVRLYQEFWKATSREEYIELYGYTTGIYENAYSCEDLMQVIKVFNDDTTPEKLKELTEACTVEDVKARIMG
ncbi:MAG: hypothetical protein Q4C61_02960 [Lachnospiraceae bacterium]|nr:hypothetical protein [Lachnospiraceae bacterium]